MKLNRTLIASAALVLLLSLAGCTAQDVARLEAVRNEAVTDAGQARAAEARVREQMAALPADDPVRRQLEAELVRVDRIAARAEACIPAIDAALKSVQDGQIDPSLAAAAGAVPYGSLALAIIGGVWGIAKHVQASGVLAAQGQTQKALQQTVAALDAVVPAPTPDQTKAMNGELDKDVQARVAALRTL